MREQRVEREASSEVTTRTEPPTPEVRAWPKLLDLQRTAGNQATRALIPSETGAPLDPAVRLQLEARFGVGLGNVRLHRGTAASASAKQLGARAFTVGTDI